MSIGREEGGGEEGESSSERCWDWGWEDDEAPENASRFFKKSFIIS